MDEQGFGTSSSATQSKKIAAPHSAASFGTNDFDHAEWARAHPVQITHKWSGEAAPASRHAEARIIWNDDALAVRFVCRQEEPLNVNANPQLNRKTMRLWDRDVCEIFLAPDPQAPHRYFEFEAAPTGEWIDLGISFTGADRATDFEFQSGMKTASRNSDGVLVTVMMIPWSEQLPKPKRGDSWRVNLFRCIGEGDERYLAWQPTYAPEPCFHVPEVFGWLEFI